MEALLPRQQIRALISAFMGETANTAQAVQVYNQRNAFIDVAYRKVISLCRWQTNTQRVTVALGISQNVLNYPTGSGPGSLIDLAYYDPNKTAGSSLGGYLTVEKRFAPAVADQDQEIAAGGATLDAVAGAPQYWWEEAGQIHLWPVSDQAYQIRLVYGNAGTFVNDTSPSVVDGELIAYYAGYLACVRKDPDLAGMFKEMFVDRMKALRAWQATGQTTPIDSSSSMDESHGSWYDSMPQWSQAPTVR